MIKFTLVCERGHEFESWFPYGEDFDAQERRGLVQCPDCDSRKVHKALMTPAVVGGRRADEPAQAVVLLDGKQRELRAAVTQIRRDIEAHTDDVGAKFPEVARAMHAGDEPHRAIRGRATVSEARALVEEGVGVMPIPILPDEAN
ncbi:MAG: DUF1178 family protein [Roseiarcus sp.]